MPDASERISLPDLALQTLQAIGPLSDTDRAIVTDSLSQSKPHRLSADLGESGDGRCWFLVEGWACRARLFPDGRRQIFNFIMPGDLVGLHRLQQPSGLFKVIALTPGVTLDAMVLKEQLRKGGETSLGHICDQSERRQAASLLDHITRLGARTAYEATADLFLELYRRSYSAGSSVDGRFPMPLSQAVLSDALGVSPIHINRILSRMRKEGIMTFGSGWVQLHDPTILESVANAFVQST